MGSLIYFRKFVREIIAENLNDIQQVHYAAQHAHKGQKRRSGDPYILHPERVSKTIQNYYPGDTVSFYAGLLHDSLEDAIDQGNVRDEEEMIAFIHDAIEDDSIAEKVTSAVMSLTKPAGVGYSDYINSIMEDPVALKIKLADMLDNIGDNPTPKQKLKYSTALRQIEKFYNGIPHFINPAHWKAINNIVSEN